MMTRIYLLLFGMLCAALCGCAAQASEPAAAPSPTPAGAYEDVLGTWKTGPDDCIYCVSIHEINPELGVVTCEATIRERGKKRTPVPSGSYPFELNGDGALVWNPDSPLTLSRNTDSGEWELSWMGMSLTHIVLPLVNVGGPAAADLPLS